MYVNKFWDIITTLQFDHLCRVYVDVVFNHMTAIWGNVTGSGGSLAYTKDLYYPGVPYRPEHFHEVCAMKPSDYTFNATQVSYGAAIIWIEAQVERLCTKMHQGLKILPFILHIILQVFNLKIFL